MKWIAVALPDDLYERLRHEAKRCGATVAEFTRDAIETHLDAPQRRLGAAAAGRSSRSDISGRIEEILAAEVVPSA